MMTNMTAASLPEEFTISGNEFIRLYDKVRDVFLSSCGDSFTETAFQQYLLMNYKARLLEHPLYGLSFTYCTAFVSPSHQALTWFLLSI